MNAKQLRMLIASMPLSLCACGGGGGGYGGGGGPATYAVGGTVTGVSGTGLVLRNNGGDLFDDISVSADGPFAFTGHLAAGSTYEVVVYTQPSSPSQVCTVTNA